MIIIGFLFFIVFIVAIIVIGWYIGTMNTLRRLQVKIQEALSGIDVALTKRFDMLTKMFDVAKSYADFEKSTLIDVIKLRQGMSMDERNQASEKMDEAASKLRVMVENYPQLGANQNFKQLQVGIMDAEEHLQAARRAYNSNVSQLNQMIVMFPASFVANMCGIGPADFFEAENMKRQDVNMKF